jgi:hypothetical protein
MHFFVKLALAAPANLFSPAAASHEAPAASLSHFFMKLFSAAPRKSKYSPGKGAGVARENSGQPA